MNFLQMMQQRELLAQMTHPEELETFLKTPQVGYVGLDPTAPSLHVGNLCSLMTLKRWEDHGHKAICVLGGGTALVGDPSGKTSMRQMMSKDQIAANIDNFKIQVSKILRNPVFLDNSSWLSGLNYLEFLREIGPHFSVNRMLTAECFKSRLEKGLSFLEFNYMLLQSYDFLHLAKHENCLVQMGGDDQWSNLLGGIELIRRLEKKQAYCLTNPLLLTSDGKKMGKTENGAVWLDSERTPPFEFFQYWRNIEDAKVREALLIFTELSVEDITELTRTEGAALNQAKKVLAFEITRLVHSEGAAEEAKGRAEQLFSGKVSADAATQVSISGQSLKSLDCFFEAKMAPSKGELRRLISQGGINVDGEPWSDPMKELTIGDLKGEGVLVRKGKKAYYRLRIEN